MTSQKATMSSKSKFDKKTQATAPFDDNLDAAVDEVAAGPGEAGDHGLDTPEDIIRPSKFILGPF
jgi:hypothetical protein